MADNDILAPTYKQNVTIMEFLPECRPFVQPYSCPLCEGILFESVIDKCGHSFCKKCADVLLKESSKCPFTKMDLHAPLSSNIIVNSVIEGQQVYCTNKQSGCEWIGKLANRLTHTNEECMKEKIQCENYPNCNVVLPRDEMNNHNTICDYRAVQCEYCDQRILFSNINEHNKLCENFPFECPNNCGSSIPQNQINIHIETQCPEAQTDCPYQVVGCEFTELRKELKKHLDDDLEKHLRMLTNKIEALNYDNKQQDKRINELTQENQILKSKLTELEDQSNSNYELIQNNINELKDDLKRCIYYSVTPYSNYFPEFITNNTRINKTFKVDMNEHTITKIDKNAGWFGVASNPIANETSSIIIVNIKLIKTVGSCIMIGITCSDAPSPVSNGYYHLTSKKDFSYVFYCFNSSLYRQGVTVLEKDKLCNEGDIITIKLDMNSKAVEFRRNGDSVYNEQITLDGWIRDLSKIRFSVDLSDCGDTVMFI